MKVKEYHEVPKHFKVGDTVWACAFEYTHHKEAKHLHQTPVLGKFMADSTEAKHHARMQRYPDDKNLNYFVPFKKNGVDLAWSKAVHMHSRCYASTEEECKELFNELIQNAIDWHEKSIEELKALQIR